MAKSRQAKKATGEDSQTALETAFGLVESLPLPVFYKSLDGRYLGVNKAWEDFFGIPRASFVGKRVADLYPQSPGVAERHAALDHELYAHPGGQRYELPIMTRGGVSRDAIYYKATYVGADGEVAGLVGAIVDITGRKHAEAAVRESEERWRSVINSANDGILVYDRSLNVTFVNRAAERILGLPAADIIGAAGFASLLPCVHEDGSPLDPETERPTRVTVRTGMPLTGYVVGIKRAEGALTWLSVNTGFLRRRDESDWYGVVSTISDITARKSAELLVRESEARYRRTFELAASGMAHIGMDRRFMRVNRRLCEILGYTEEELLRLRGRDISHPDDLDVINEQRPSLYSGAIDAVRLEKRYLRKDRSVVWVAFTMVVERDAAGQPQYEIGVYDDITARKAAEQALSESEARFRRTFQLASSGLAHVSLDGRFLRVNPRLCEIFGYPETELVGLSVKDISHPEDRDAVNVQRGRLVAGEIDSVRLEKRYLRKDGAVVWVGVAIALERDAAGRPLYAISVLDDITSRKHAEAALRDTEEHWRSIVNSANEGMLVYDRALNVMSGNLAAERILGLPLGEMIGKPGFTSLLPCVREDGSPLSPENRPTRITLSTGEPQTGLVLGIKRAGGSVTWLSVNTAFLRRPGEEQHYGIVSTISDITARRQAEEALRESEDLFRKTFELGASGIAHVSLDGRFLRSNRRLSAILGYPQGELIGCSVKEI
ncbi:MAG TPA: PAS domain S-box protein, partial [Burkholderiales bacterium]|nr:PAS domain S-box protein [Burkholderiales bacterium]